MQPMIQFHSVIFVESGSGPLLRLTPQLLRRNQEANTWEEEKCDRNEGEGELIEEKHVHAQAITQCAQDSQQFQSAEVALRWACIECLNCIEGFTRYIGCSAE